MKPFLFLSLAVLAAVASAQVDDLPRKGWFGAALQPVEGGVKILTILPGAPVEGRLKVGDVVKSINGKPVPAPAAVTTIVNATPPTGNLEITVSRDGKDTTFTVPMKSRPVDTGPNYEVRYDHVVSKGHRLRLMVSRPKNVAGKRPTIFWITGIGNNSVDAPISGPSGMSQILQAFTDRGYATVRVEKPGVGDSEGDPAPIVDFEGQLDGYRQGLKALTKYDFIDRDKVVVIGISMGGAWGPIVASEVPVKGVAIWGTNAKSWLEYFIENHRRQMPLNGMSLAETDKTVREIAGAGFLVFEQGMDPAEVKEKFPRLRRAIDEFMFEDGKTMSGMSLAYWRQLAGYNFADLWGKVNTNVLAMRGEWDFVTAPEDHKLIADLANAKRPGSGVWKIVPGTDHLFTKTTSYEDSLAKFGKPGGEFNPVVRDEFVNWVQSIIDK